MVLKLYENPTDKDKELKRFNLGDVAMDILISDLRLNQSHVLCTYNGEATIRY